MAATKKTTGKKSSTPIDSPSEVIQPSVPEIATGDPALDEQLKTLTGALADLKQEAALRVIQKLRSPALPKILLGYLSDETLDIKPYTAVPHKELGKLRGKAREQREQRDHREALAFSWIVEFVKWTMRALAARHDPAGDERLVEIFSTHPVTRVRYDAGDAIVRPPSAESMFDYTQRPATGSPRALEGVARLLDRAGAESDEKLIRLAVQAVFKLDPAKAYDRLAPCLLDGDTIKKGPVSDAIFLVAGWASTRHADPRWQALAVRLLGDKDRGPTVLHFFESHAPPEIVAPIGEMVQAGIKIQWIDAKLLRLLGMTRRSEAARYILEAMESKALDGSWYSVATEALDQIGDKAIVPELERLARVWKDDERKAGKIRDLARKLG